MNAASLGSIGGLGIYSVGHSLGRLGGKATVLALIALALLVASVAACISTCIAGATTITKADGPTVIVGVLTRADERPAVTGTSKAADGVQVDRLEMEVRRVLDLKEMRATSERFDRGDIHAAAQLLTQDSLCQLGTGGLQDAPTCKISRDLAPNARAFLDRLVDNRHPDAEFEMSVYRDLTVDGDVHDDDTNEQEAMEEYGQKTIELLRLAALDGSSSANDRLEEMQRVLRPSDLQPSN